MAESRIPVNAPKTVGQNLKSWESLDGEGFVVQSEAVTLTDATGHEVLVAKESTLAEISVLLAEMSALVAKESTLLEIATSVAVLGAQLPGAETLVASGAPVMLLPLNPTRRGIVIQNNGSANVRIGLDGVTATTGLRLLPDAILTASPPFLPINALWAIAEDDPTIVFASEIV